MTSTLEYEITPTKKYVCHMQKSRDVRLCTLVESLKEKTLSELVDNSKTDKNTRHSYLQTYQNLFANMKNTATSIAEIGIDKGGSIKLWKDFFNFAQIYAIDIMPLSKVWHEIQKEKRINLYTSADAYSPDFVTKNFKNIKFDILVDDGPHTLESMIAFIELYLPLLKEKGILVIEDVQSIDWIRSLTNAIPHNLRKFIQVYDLRKIKGRYDDILFIVNKNQN
jgi:cephalosporin hydroxylase